MDGRETELLARSRLPAILGEALGVAPDSIRVDEARNLPYDLEAVGAGRSFLVEVLAKATPATLASHWMGVASAVRKVSEVPVIVVPYMSGASAAFCDANDINWLDLSGNANIEARGLRIRLLGNPNAYVRRGRRPSVFERRSSRLARVMLELPGRDWSVREAAKVADLDEGHVSRIVARLVADELLSRDEKRRFRVQNPRLLLDAWRESADFSKHRILRGHVFARSGEELLRQLSSRLSKTGLSHAATGLGAAWLYDHFAMFRLATCFLHEWPTPTQLEQLHFREEPNGANVWLVLPNDDGVFEGGRQIEGVPCVHPVQVYVDLKDQPERSAEAADQLRANPILLGADHVT